MFVQTLIFEYFSVSALSFYICINVLIGTTLAIFTNEGINTKTVDFPNSESDLVYFLCLCYSE